MIATDDAAPGPCCPDCAATVDDRRRLAHVETCPLGLATDRRRDRDREWFERHPDAGHYRRPIDPAEVADLKLVGAVPDDAEVVGHVTSSRCSRASGCAASTTSTPWSPGRHRDRRDLSRPPPGAKQRHRP